MLESLDHLFYDCSHAKCILKMVEDLVEIKVEFGNGISSGSLLEGCKNYNRIFVVSIYAATIWWIWKGRCNLIFKDTPLNHLWDAKFAVDHV